MVGNHIILTSKTKQSKTKRNAVQEIQVGYLPAGSISLYVDFINIFKNLLALKHIKS